MPNTHMHRDAGIREQTSRPPDPSAPESLGARQGRRAKQLAIGGSILVIWIAAVLIWMWQGGGSYSQKIPQVAPGKSQLITIEPRAVSTDLNIMGLVGPVRSVPVVAPFDGVISEKLAQTGDTVKVGDVLLTLDPGDITSQFRTAQSIYLKAQMGLEAMESWDTSPDVLRAKRALQASEAALGVVDRQLGDIRKLFDQGIVSRDEFNSIVQQRDNQQVQVDGLRQDLQSVLDRGNADNQQLLKLDFENAADKLKDLKQQLSGAKVSAAASGILTSPPIDRNSDRVTVEAGVRVTRGAPLFSIADTTSFLATGRVDEIDVNHIKVGQPVTIVCDAIPNERLTGRIVTVSSEGQQQPGSSQASEFEVRALFSPQSDAQRQAIKLGMSARISVETYGNPSALVVPAEAVTSNGKQQPTIIVVRGGRTQAVPINLGDTFPEGVEIKSGIAAGDQVMMGNPPIGTMGGTSSSVP